MCLCSTSDVQKKVIALPLCPQKKYEGITEEQMELKVLIKERQEMTKKFKERTEKLTKTLKKDKIAFEEQFASEKVGVCVFLCTVEVFLWSQKSF